MHVGAVSGGIVMLAERLAGGCFQPKVHFLKDVLILRLAGRGA